ncbi:hypothetical protein OHY99_19635 [Serratia marcescens]|uniref:hypothetical protein n=1 Tax=Serratia marcescens TaxID=615 RepID=UPI00221EADE8|nr:hypothetical protein [Serratia marcescens]UYU03043.1 hypothetical protein OHY99_19635 [Serratia marcescens]
MTLTTERLREIASSPSFSANPLSHEVKYMARELLANREAQPVGFRYRHMDTASWLYNDWRWPDSVEAEQCQIEWLYTALPAPANARAVAWEMRYWNSGHNMWHDWERITAEQHAEMSVQHATDNDYEFRVLYDAPAAPAVQDEIDSFADQVIGTKDKIIRLPAPMPVPLEGIRVYLNADAIISYLEKQGYIVEVSRE